jgi:hypothetical protein
MDPERKQMWTAIGRIADLVDNFHELKMVRTDNEYIDNIWNKIKSAVGVHDKPTQFDEEKHKQVEELTALNNSLKSLQTALKAQQTAKLPTNDVDAKISKTKDAITANENYGAALESGQKIDREKNKVDDTLKAMKSEIVTLETQQTDLDSKLKTEKSDIDTKKALRDTAVAAAK